MKVWALGAGLCLLGTVAYGQAASPIVGKWCDNSHQNGTRTLIVEKLDGSKVTGRYQWSGPGPLNEPIGGTFSDGKFTGGSTVYLNIAFNQQGELVGTAKRQEELRVTFKRCQ